MLWSVIKIVVFLGLILAASFAAMHLLSLEGGVRIVMAGYEVNLTPLNAIITLALLLLMLWLLLKLGALLVALLRFINGDETAMSRYFDRNRQEKGYRALTEGMMALASGEGKLAMSRAARAEKYLHKPELTNLLTAQAAELTGDRRTAEEVYKRLLKDDKTRFVGVRGLLKQKIEEGDTDTALKLAETAFGLKPTHEEVQDTLLQLQAGQADWKGARATLNAKLKHGSLPRDLHRRRDAILALAEARDIAAENSTIEAKETAIEANRLSPHLVPAAVMAAQAYIEDGSKRYATRVIRKAWESQPHPDLAAAYAAIEPDETPDQRLKRFAKLFKLSPDHPEAKLVEAELQIAAEDFPAARRALGTLAETAPDARSLTIMAAIERGAGANDTVVKGWLARAVAAARGPQWICENCQHIHHEWAPTCAHCHAVDTLEWRNAPGAAPAMPTGVAMLPLIVGALEEPAQSPKAEPEAESPETDAATSSGTAPEADIVDAEIVDDASASDTQPATDTQAATQAETQKETRA
ncbi:heme biosynthesis protein HemY [Roseovarius nubinhibens]|uniref:HemY domain protein n=1 Tax=Roseovarius nubinhibens (strain ATCC BAA-591 / DSM 15170 / ISM) TaxID=89187 RepID=A3SJP5_ROSNI|nr:heme biosynthesis HemY N-terminal domain-containing protein [Roseovarius nubinhibens]EAP77576.1 HemY domain protein [Roseovarius nubinhibens ISM]